MIKHIGSQIREPIEETEYKIQFRDEHLVLSETGAAQFEDGPEVVLLNTITGKEELWVERDHFAGYVVEIDGKGFEFVRTLS